MDVYLYAQHKWWILESAYSFFAGSYQLRFGSELRDHNNYVCFDSLIGGIKCEGYWNIGEPKKGWKFRDFIKSRTGAI